ncbi:hypothetical protein TNCV_4751741 [Trichonephila clavipes]|nr:hypothetical protein TNCV_4751741 [Trichonephila clavipes]
MLCLHIEKLLADFSARKTNIQNYFFYFTCAFVDGCKQKWRTILLKILYAIKILYIIKILYGISDVLHETEAAFLFMAQGAEESHWLELQETFIWKNFLSSLQKVVPKPLLWQLSKNCMDWTKNCLKRVRVIRPLMILVSRRWFRSCMIFFQQQRCRRFDVLPDS